MCFFSDVEIVFVFCFYRLLSTPGVSDNGCSAIAPSDAAQLRNTPARRERCHRISVSPLWAHRHRSCAQVRPQYGAPEKPKQTQRGKTCVRYIAHSAACNRNPDRARRSFMFASIRLPWICTRRGTRLLTLLCLRRCGNCHVVKCKGGAEKHVKNPSVSCWPD